MGTWTPRLRDQFLGLSQLRCTLYTIFSLIPTKPQKENHYHFSSTVRKPEAQRRRLDELPEDQRLRLQEPDP